MKGRFWIPSTDKFLDSITDKFMVKVNIVRSPMMRRGLLSMLSQIYNPLGMLGLFLLAAQHLVQGLFHKGSSGTILSLLMKLSSG